MDNLIFNLLIQSTPNFKQTTEDYLETILFGTRLIVYLIVILLISLIINFIVQNKKINKLQNIISKMKDEDKQ